MSKPIKTTDSSSGDGALKAALETLTNEELRTLAQQLADDPTVRPVLQTLVPIPTELLTNQPHNTLKVAKLKQAVTDFVSNFGGSYYYDNYDDDEEDYEELGKIVEEAALLHPEDAITVVRHMLTATKSIFGDVMFGTRNLEEGLRLYGRMLGILSLDMPQKHRHLEWLISLLDLEANQYGDFTEAIGEALTTAATQPEDYQFLIDALRNKENTTDWILVYHRALGDDDSYLRLRHENLFTEKDFLDLADYWQQKGDEAAYIATLEQWCTDVEERAWTNGDADIPLERAWLPGIPGEDGVIQKLSSHYHSVKDDANLLRVLMFGARHEALDLERYKQIKDVANRLQIWPKTQDEVFAIAKRNTHTLAEIYLYEQHYPEAIELTNAATRNKEPNKDLILLVAPAIRETHPQEAITMYQRLVQHYIDHKKRWAYAEAAGYAKEIKLIYEVILREPAAWQKYIRTLVASYTNYPALQDEFRSLASR